MVTDIRCHRRQIDEKETYYSAPNSLRSNGADRCDISPVKPLIAHPTSINPLRLFLDQIIVDHQHIQTGCIKYTHGVFYRMNYRFTHDIKTGI